MIKNITRFFAWIFSIAVFGGILVFAVVWSYIGVVSEGLPDHSALKSYEPPIISRVYASNGSLLAEYARERRLFLPAQAIPDKVKQAYISAEDKNFYTHPGIDYMGIGRALYRFVENIGSGRRPQGASTITQQVARNFFLTREVSFDRKFRELLLAFRIEAALGKEEILELYLNHIYLGLHSYGVAAAALNYFDKSVNELTLAEIAYLAALPKAPENYHPFRNRQRAIARRNWVLARMEKNGYISHSQMRLAQAEPLQIKTRETGAFIPASEYFAEAVRRELNDQYGEEALYVGGLNVRSTLDPEMQRWAQDALREGLVKYDEKEGWRGAVTHISPSIVAGGNWGEALAQIEPLKDLAHWQLAIVLEVDEKRAVIGLRPQRRENGRLVAKRRQGVILLEDMKWAAPVTAGIKGRSPLSVEEVLAVGEVIYVEAKSDESGSNTDSFLLRQIPEISGGLVALDPHTGRVMALVGGFSYDLSQFNRVTQAYRQPGSSYKPFVYLAALQNGYSPTSIMMDAPLEVNQKEVKINTSLDSILPDPEDNDDEEREIEFDEQGNPIDPEEEIWRPQNYSGKFLGPITLRTGIERSANAMTVRLAQDIGMALVAEYGKLFGVYENMPKVLAMSLGAGETTLMRMATAYAMIANGGYRIEASLIDRVQDKYGKTIYRHDRRNCNYCVANYWQEDISEPSVHKTSERIIDAVSAYQMTSMMQGVVQRGTGTVLRDLGIPLAGKTGTSNDERDAWFIGFTSNLVVGVYVGFDTPKPMGKGATGGGLAAPIAKSFFRKAIQKRPPTLFPVPQGIELVRVDRDSGVRASAGGKDVILEALREGTIAADRSRLLGINNEEDFGVTVSGEAEETVSQGTGNIY